jgi:hypothetical protein
MSDATNTEIAEMKRLGLIEDIAKRRPRKIIQWTPYSDRHAAAYRQAARNTSTVYRRIPDISEHRMSCIIGAAVFMANISLANTMP